MRRIITVALLVGSVLTAFADTWTDPDTGYTWTYRIVDDGAEIYNDEKVAVSPSPSGALTIPSTLGGKVVKRVGARAFYNCRGLTSVKLPDSVESIGEYAFYDCYNIMRVELPQCVCEKGMSSVFMSSYSSITNITLTAGVTNVWSRAFDGCRGLRSFAVAEGNPSYKAESGMLLTKDGRTLVRGLHGAIVVPDGVEAIGSHAFYSHNLTSVTFPDGLKSIGAYAFYNCRGLNGVSIPSSVTGIGEYAFNYCYNIMSVSVPQCVCEKGMSSVFSSSYSSITNITLTAGATNVWPQAFDNCRGLTSITIPPSVTSVGNNAFNACNNLKTITLLGDVFAGVANLPWNAISLVYYSIAYEDNWGPIFDQYDVEEVIALEMLDYDIQEEVVGGKKWRYFENDGGAVVFSGGLGGAVSPVSSGEELVIPETLGGLPVVEIGFGAFKGLSDLTRVSIPSTVTNIADYAFYGCSSLAEISIPVAVQSIGNRSFAYCSKLAQVEFTAPSALVNVGNAAFRGCESMDVEAFVLPDTVEHVGKGALLFVLPKILGGTINSSTTLSQGAVYVVSNSVTVASGVTLTVPPGTILKFNNGCSLTVSSGATLNAIGTRAQPIVFTSLKDDEHGDDTNDDGDDTYPWRETGHEFTRAER